MGPCLDYQPEFQFPCSAVFWFVAAAGKQSLVTCKRWMVCVYNFSSVFQVPIGVFINPWWFLSLFIMPKLPFIQFIKLQCVLIFLLLWTLIPYTNPKLVNISFSPLLPEDITSFVKAIQFCPYLIIIMNGAVGSDTKHFVCHSFCLVLYIVTTHLFSSEWGRFLLAVCEGVCYNMGISAGLGLE